MFSQQFSTTTPPPSSPVLCVERPFSVMAPASHPYLQCPSNAVSTFCHLLEAIGIFVFLMLLMWFCCGMGHGLSLGYMGPV